MRMLLALTALIGLVATAAADEPKTKPTPTKPAAKPDKPAPILKVGDPAPATTGPFAEFARRMQDPTTMQFAALLNPPQDRDAVNTREYGLSRVDITELV